MLRSSIGSGSSSWRISKRTFSERKPKSKLQAWKRINFQGLLLQLNYALLCLVEHWKRHSALLVSTATLFRSSDRQKGIRELFKLFLDFVVRENGCMKEFKKWTEDLKMLTYWHLCSAASAVHLEVPWWRVHSDHR